MELVTRRMNPTKEDIKRFADCFTANGWPRSEVWVEWQYLNNPTGEIYVDFALDPSSQATAGIYASMPFWAKVGSEKVLAIQSCDTLTDQDHRGRGVFTSLASSLFSSAAHDGVGLIYGFPNGNSAPGFFGKLGWQSLDPVPFLMRPIRSNYFVKRLFPKIPSIFPNLPTLPLAYDFDIIEVGIEDIPVDEIWAEFAGNFEIGVVRDLSYFKWRLAKPDQNYRVFAAQCRGITMGFVVVNIMEKHDGLVGYIVELMTRATSIRQEVAHELLHYAMGHFERNGCDAALAWHFSHSPYYVSYLMNGFLPLPEKLRPIELHFGIKDLALKCGKSREDWYISYCDSDTV